MGLALATLLAILGVEFVLRAPVLVCTRSLVSIVRKSMWMIRSSRSSDQLKEVVLLQYARELFRHSLFLTLILLGLFLLVTLPAIVIDRWLELSPSIIDSFFSPLGLTIITTVSAFYAIVRQRFF